MFKVKKKLKKSAELLAILLGMSSPVYANVITSPIDIPSGGNLSINENIDINIPATTTQKYAIHLDSNATMTNAPGTETNIYLNANNNWTVNVGIWASYGSNLTLDKLTINDSGYSKTIEEKSSGIISNNGRVTIGDNAFIKVGYTSVYATWEDAEIIIGNHAYLETSMYDGGSGTVTTRFGGTIKIGDSAVIINDGRNLGGGPTYNGYHQAVVAVNGDISIGNNSQIYTYGSKRNVGITAGDVAGTDAGIVTIGENATIKTEGAYSYGLYSVNEGSKITIASGSKIETNGANAYAVVALQGGDIEFIGDQTIIGSDVGDNGALVSIYTNGKSATEKSVVTGDGKLEIVGSLYSDNYGDIDLHFRNGSKFTGGAEAVLTGTVNLSMDSGSIWNMNEDSAVTSLAMNGGKVAFSSDDYRTLEVENLQGNQGFFGMRADIFGQQGDLLEITGSSEGNHQVMVANQGSAAVDGTEKITIIKTNDGIANFTNINAVELGGYKYNLRRVETNNKNWELYGEKRATSTGSASVNVFSGGYLLNYAETQTLLQRMGDLRQDSNDGGVWARAYGGKFTSSADGFLSGFDMSYSGMQVGADKKIALKNKGNIYVGGMFGYSKGNLDYGVGSGSIDSKTLGAYGTYMAPTGFYADLVLKYGWMKNDFKVLDSAGDWVTGDDMSTDGLSASLEVGQRIHLDRKKKEGWYLEPQAQISMGHQSGGSFKASNGLQVDVDSYTSTLGRLGLNAGYEVKSGKNPINIYAKMSYVHEFDGDVGYRLNGSREQTSFGDSWWTYGLGVTAQINKKHNVYLDIERASGGQFNQPWSFNGGYRFNW